MTLNARASWAVVGFATIIALGTRISAVMASSFPLNDGGLFYRMITDLLANRLALPKYGSYNGVSIPFAYPPLGLYLYAIINLISRIPLLQLVQYGPPILSVATIPAFYPLARDMLESEPQAAFATIVFALVPRSFDWLIMGGGVTRTFGMLFALLAMRQALRLFTQGPKPGFVLLIVFGSLVVFSHPEAATHTAITAVLFYFWFNRSRRGLAYGLLAAVAILAATAPWWGTVLAQHGFGPFAAASSAARQDSYNPLVGLLALIQFQFADEPFVTIFTVLGLVGIGLQLARRRYLLPIWLLAMHLLEPRGGTLFMTIPLAMCAGIAIAEVILPALARNNASADAAVSTNAEANWLDAALRGRMARTLIGFLIVYGMMAAYATAWRTTQEFTLRRTDVQAMEWVRANTDGNSSFAIVSGGLPLRDATSEWFPALTDRRSVGTVFGYEWVPGTDFVGRVRLYQALQACAGQDLACLDTWAHDFGLNFDYVYLREPGVGSRTALGVLLGQSPQYALVYSSANIQIYQRRGTALIPAVGGTSD
jgi:hypothetical protein